MTGHWETHTGLFTDHYELVMAQGYFLSGKKDTRAVFDYFYRDDPYGGGYVVLAGLSELAGILEEFIFSEEDCRYLLEIGFDPNFIEYLKAFRFGADLYGPEEGEIVFPQEPVARVEGSIIETQLIETLLLNILNFESLIATKAARIRQVAGDRVLLDFGLRRAQGLGGIQAGKAAIAGGFDKTSNVYSAYRYKLESTGTMAHSWVQSFSDELTAFRKFAAIYPDTAILLVDTYDTLKSGLPNAIRVGREMKEQGKNLFGIRLDSGDLAFLSKQARKMLDDAGLREVRIVVSNQLDEYVIKSLLEQSAPIDAFGVGTALVTGKGAGALDGVYKLCMIDESPTLKVSENIWKTTLPGRKSVYRFSDGDGWFVADAITLEGEEAPETIHHPFEPGKKSHAVGCLTEKLHSRVMKGGKTVRSPKNPRETAEYAHSRLSLLPVEHKRFMNPHVYKVGISPALLKLRNEMTEPFNRKNAE